MALKAGTSAPNFRLLNTEKKEVSLGDYKGRTLVIHFFPAAFTGVCTAQMCTNRDEANFYSGIHAAVVGISVDSHFSLAVFKEKNALNFELLSDFNKQTIHEYEMYFCNFAGGMMRGVAKRGVAVVDKDGIIQYTEETASPGDQVNFVALKDALQKIK